MSLEFDALLLETSLLLDKEAASLLAKSGNGKLAEAMRYSALSTGKRLRPFMLLSVADIYGVERKYSMRAAAAIELVHSYSLIHDDLPAMDDDDYRRGILSCHKQFNEATAILAGDSLLTLAFEILAEPASHPDPSLRCDLIRILAENIGAQGVAGGQMLDLIYEREMLANYTELTNMHWMKTSRLFIACCMMGAKLGNADHQSTQHLLKYAEYYGLAFQFADDLADLAIKKHLSNNNIVKLMGAKETKIIMDSLIIKARDEIIFLGPQGLHLDQLALNLYR